MNETDARASVPAPRFIAVTVSVSSTSAKVSRLAHINAAPAAAASAPSQASAPTLSQAGENTSRAANCRATSSP